MQKIDKYFSIHRPAEGDALGACICEAETREDALTCAYDSLWNDRADNADYGAHSESVVLCVNYESGDYSYEHLEIELSVEQDNSVDVARSDYLAGVL